MVQRERGAGDERLDAGRGWVEEPAWRVNPAWPDEPVVSPKRSWDAHPAGAARTVKDALRTPNPPPAVLLARARRQLESRLRRAVEDTSPPTWALGVSSGTQVIEAPRARQVLDLAARVAEATLATGFSAADVTATALQLTRAYGLRGVHVDVTFAFVVLSAHGGADRDPITIMRTVGTRGADFDRLARIQDLVTDLTEDTPPVAEARARFDAIMRRPRPYRRGVVTLAGGVFGAALAVLFGATAVTVALTAISSMLADRVQLAASRRGAPAFFGRALGGAVPTAIALGVMAGRARGIPWLADATPSVIVSAGIVMLLAGVGVVGAAQDAMDGYYVTAGARAMEVLMLTLGLVAGVLLALGIGQRLGVPMVLIVVERVPNVALQLALAALAAAAFAVMDYARPRTALVASGCGAAGLGGSVLAVTLGAGTVLASAAGALAVGLLAQFLARTLRVPALALSMSGIVLLLPGSMVYRGLYASLGQDAGAVSGVSTLATAGLVGLALAAGVSLGTFFGRRFARGRTSTGHLDALAVALRRSRPDVRE